MCSLFDSLGKRVRRWTGSSPAPVQGVSVKPASEEVARTAVAAS
jgi:hypothetical protein